MPQVKLAKLPDRKPVKLVVHVLPELHQRLSEYASAYEQSYGQRATVPDLVPAMLDAFLQSDRDFTRQRK